MVVTRSMSGATKKPDDTKSEIDLYNDAQRARKLKWKKERKQVLQTWRKERKETFLKQFRDKYPLIQTSKCLLIRFFFRVSTKSPKIIDSGEKQWLKKTREYSFSLSSKLPENSVAELEKILTLDLILEPFIEDLIKELNIAKSDPADEKASKALREELKKNGKMVSDWGIDDTARYHLTITFTEQFSKKYPEINIKYKDYVFRAEEKKVWSCMTESAKATYIAQVEKRLAEQLRSMQMCHGLIEIKEMPEL